MARKFLNKKNHRFHFIDSNGDPQSYKLIFGDEVNTLQGAGPSGGAFRRVRYRGRVGEWVPPPLTGSRSLEMYFLDVGQGDAAFVVTPNGTKILVDGGLKDRALGFLIWKYRLDLPGNEVTIDHLMLSHADKDHVDGLIPLLGHPRIHVTNIHHNGIGLFSSGFNTSIGTKTTSGRLNTIHDSVQDLNGLNLADGNGAVFKKWIDAVEQANANYGRLDSTEGTLDVGDPDIVCEIIGPRLESNGSSFTWFKNKSHTINGHSLVFRMTYDRVRTFFSGDLNEEGSEHLLDQPNAALNINSHIFKAPHHGSHEFSHDLFSAVNPMITVVSSGEIPDHGHPRANFIGAIGKAGRGESLVFSTAAAALFQDEGDPVHVADAGTETELGGLDFSLSSANVEARKRFKKVLPGIINVRTDGQEMYAYRRVQQYYQWEAYGPIAPIQ